MERNEVSAAFEIVLEEIETVVNNLNQDGAGAFHKGDYDTAKGLIEMATRLTDFRGKVRTLQKEWENLFSTRIPKKPSRQKRFARLRPGLRTQEDAYRRPILEALVELGDSVATSQVLDRVGEKMKDVLNEYDRRPMSSHPDIVRWRNSTEWCRYALVQEGLMKAGSRQGTWEISQRGKDALARGEIS